MKKLAKKLNGKLIESSEYRVLADGYELSNYKCKDYEKEAIKYTIRT
ncbi:hypothetical protein [Bacillus sp. FJAT-22090]|nr:hypothetical protein [Bacillus sp. FJAT-22090]